MFLIIVLMMLAPMAAWAQVPDQVVSCQSFSWQANPESDLAGYLMKRTDLTASMSTTNPIDRSITEVDCSQWILEVGHDYQWSMAAVDTSHNQSPWTSVRFTVVAADQVPPGAVMLFCGTFTGPDGQPKKICAIEIP